MEGLAGDGATGVDPTLAPLAPVRPASVGPHPPRPAAAPPPRRATVHRHRLRRRRPRKPARPLPPSPATRRRARPDPPPRRPLPGAARASRHFRCSTGWPATAGCASAPTTACSPRRHPRPPDRRQEGHRLGTRARPRVRGRPAHVFVAGSSAGAHLAATGRPDRRTTPLPTRLRGRRHAVAAAIGLYGYYGPVDFGRQPCRPRRRLAHAGRTAVLLMPTATRTRSCRSSDAREFVDRAAPHRRTTLSSTPSCPAASTPSTSSTRSASRRSSTPSRHSPPGHGHIRESRLDTDLPRSPRLARRVPLQALPMVASGSSGDPDISTRRRSGLQARRWVRDIS